MQTELRILTGTRAGYLIPLADTDLLIGRHPTCGLRFDPDSDLVVSSRHAIIERRRDAWWIRDLGSTNGTWVNGRPIEAPVLLSLGDQIRFGDGGPAAEVRARPAMRESTTSRVRAQVAGQMRRVRIVLIAVILLVVAGGAFVIQLRRRQESAWLRERSVLQQQIDSLLVAGQSAVQSLRGEVRGLDEALRESESRVRGVSSELESARARLSSDQTEQLRRDLQAAKEALRRQQLAATLDFRNIEKKNRYAVTRIFVESAKGDPSSATAFAIRADGLLVTSRHVVSDPSGRQRPRRMAVQFSDSDQYWNAVVVAVSTEVDLALVRVLGVMGDVPTVHHLNARSDTIAPGSPVAIIGFPLGGITRVSAEMRGAPAEPLLSAAIIRTNRESQLEIEGYGAAGASGSPILDRNGEVIGVLYGGRRDPQSGESTVLAVPVSAVLRLLADAR